MAYKPECMNENDTIPFYDFFLRGKTECDLKDDMARTKQIEETDSKS